MFLLTNVNLENLLGKLFLIFNNPDIKFIKEKSYFKNFYNSKNFINYLINKNLQ